MECKKYTINNFFLNIFSAEISSEKAAVNTAHGIRFSGGTNGIKTLYVHFWLENCTAAFSKDLSNDICQH
jgi:hypothetical protein